jgi:hypothetical protein
MKRIENCKNCNKKYKNIKGYRYCKNLGCTQYNKKFGKKLQTKIVAQEEE